MTIELEHNGNVREFEFQHAVRLLRLEAKQGRTNWTIKTEGYEFKEDEIIKRQDKRTSKKTEE